MNLRQITAIAALLFATAGPAAADSFLVHIHTGPDNPTKADRPIRAAHPVKRGSPIDIAARRPTTGPRRLPRRSRSTPL